MLVNLLLLPILMFIAQTAVAVGKTSDNNDNKICLSQTISLHFTFVERKLIIHVWLICRGLSHKCAALLCHITLDRYFKHRQKAFSDFTSGENTTVWFYYNKKKNTERCYGNNLNKGTKIAWTRETNVTKWNRCT